MSRLAGLLVAVLLPVIAGCSTDGSQYASDRTGRRTLQPLIKQHEYARARQLTGKYPSLDTMEIQAWITSQESEYEAAVFSDARTLEKDNDLLGAVQLLSAALQKLPHSTLLRETAQHHRASAC